MSADDEIKRASIEAAKRLLRSTPAVSDAFKAAELQKESDDGYARRMKVYHELLKPKGIIPGIL